MSTSGPLTLRRRTSLTKQLPNKKLFKKSYTSNNITNNNNKISNKKKYSEEEIRSAAQKAQQRMENNEDPKYQQLSEEFGVPASTISSRVVNGILVQGSLFTETEEKQIIKHIQLKQNGNPLTKKDLLDLVNTYLMVINFNFVF